MTTTLDDALVAELAGQVSGSVLGPQDMGYHAARAAWLTGFTRGLPDALIDLAVERFAAVPSPMSAILLEHFHGAVTRVGVSETFAAMRPHLGTGRWLNYLGDDQAADAVRAAYGPHYERLREVKRRYDRDNVFHLNHNIGIGEG
jgi:Berberine and berberine like